MRMVLLQMRMDADAKMSAHLCVYFTFVILCCFFAAMWIDFVLQHGSREEHMPSFLRWLSDHGVDTSAVAIEQFADAGYGLKAMRDIRVSTVM